MCEAEDGDDGTVRSDLAAINGLYHLTSPCSSRFDIGLCNGEPTNIFGMDLPPQSPTSGGSGVVMVTEWC